MKIHEFIAQYSNHPVLFVGTGISLRYLKNSYTWEGLLKKISKELKGNDEFFLDLKSQSEKSGSYDYCYIATRLETEFNKSVSEDRNGKFKHLNDIFYENMTNGTNISRFKLYISEILSDTELRDGVATELASLVKARKNISSIITTNYDTFIESQFSFKPLVGNDILLSTPYGSAYKIHGCISHPQKIIITTDDYNEFHSKYELIRAQLLSIFIHNPIIFIGYSVSDDNIKAILRTIFTYVDPNSPNAEKIRKNFLLVEYAKDINNWEILDHDIDIEGFATIKINKIKSDSFIEIYESIANLELPVSAMDIRKVQNVVKDIYQGGSIKVSITEDLDSLQNSDKIIAIGSKNTIQYHFQTHNEMMSEYFTILDEANTQRILTIDKFKIHKSQYFPIYGFYTICKTILSFNALSKIQDNKISEFLSTITERFQTGHNSIQSIIDDQNIAQTYKNRVIFWCCYNATIPLRDLESYLKTYPDKNTTDYRKLLCLYDKLNYNPAVPLFNGIPFY